MASTRRTGRPIAPACTAACACRYSARKRWTKLTIRRTFAMRQPAPPRARRGLSRPSVSPAARAGRPAARQGRGRQCGMGKADDDGIEVDCVEHRLVVGPAAHAQGIRCLCSRWGGIGDATSSASPLRRAASACCRPLAKPDHPDLIGSCLASCVQDRLSRAPQWVALAGGAQHALQDARRRRAGHPRRHSGPDLLTRRARTTKTASTSCPVPQVISARTGSSTGPKWYRLRSTQTTSANAPAGRDRSGRGRRRSGPSRR